MSDCALRLLLQSDRGIRPSSQLFQTPATDSEPTVGKGVCRDPAGSSITPGRFCMERLWRWQNCGAERIRHLSRSAPDLPVRRRPVSTALLRSEGIRSPSVSKNPQNAELTQPLDTFAATYYPRSSHTRLQYNLNVERGTRAARHDPQRGGTLARAAITSPAKPSRTPLSRR